MGFIIILLFIGIDLWLVRTMLQGKQISRRKLPIYGGISIIFLLLIVTGVLDWGIRYFGLFFLLASNIVISLVAFIRNKPLKRMPGKISTAIGFIIRCIGYVIAVLPLFLFPQYQKLDTTGNFPVAAYDVTFTDSNRMETYAKNDEKRAVNATFWYPEKADENSPLVIFSHGLYGVRYSNESLFRELASHGYTVCSIDHPYHSFYTKDDQGKTTTVSMDFLKEYQEASESKDLSVMLKVQEEWLDIRTADIEFILDRIRLETQKNDSKSFYHNIDLENIAISGHSLGGSVALKLGRELENVKAVMALESPYFGDLQGVSEDGSKYLWNEEEYPIPTLNFYSDATWKWLQEDPLYEQNAKYLEGSKSVMSVHIEGTGHLGLTDLSLVSPMMTSYLDRVQGREPKEVLQEINRETLDFFNTYMNKK